MRDKTGCTHCRETSAGLITFLVLVTSLSHTVLYEAIYSRPPNKSSAWSSVEVISDVTSLGGRTWLFGGWQRAPVLVMSQDVITLSQAAEKGPL